MHVSQHVEQPQFVGQELAAWPRAILGVLQVPGILPEEFHRSAVIATGNCTRPAGIFPFRLGWQPVACSLQGIGTDLHPLGVLALIVRFVALRQVLPAGSASCSRQRHDTKRHCSWGLPDRGCTCCFVGMIDFGILLHEPWYCSTVTSLVAMAKHRLMGWRCGVSLISRSGSLTGDPMENSTGPSITARVWPSLFTYQRRLPRSLSFFNSTSIACSFSLLLPLP